MMSKIENFLFALFMITTAAVFVLLIWAGIVKDNNNNAFIDACETMGGVAVVGNYGTKACFKSEVLK